MRTGSGITGRTSAAVVLALWLLVLVAGALALRFGPTWLTDPEAFRSFFLSFGPFAALAFVLVQAAQVVIAPLPGQLLGFVAGYLFGAVLGTALSLVGATIGTYVAVGLARRYGRPAVERLVHPDTIDQFDAAVEHRGLLALFVVFLVPGLPDDAVCLAAGLTRLPVRSVLAVSLVGRLPGYALVAVAGDRLAGGHTVDSVALLVLLAAASISVYLGRARISRWLAGDAAG